MKKMHLLLASVLVSAIGTAQSDHRLDPPNISRGHIAVDLGNGQTMYGIDRNFGFDSSYVVLARANANMEIEELRAHRLHLPLTFFNALVPIDDGYLVGGTNYGFIDYAFVLKTDFIGSVDWYQGLSDLGHGQDQFVKLFSNGTSFTGYTYPGGEYRDGIYRINGNASQGMQNGMEIVTPATTRFRVYDGVATSDPEVHMLCGSGYQNDASTTKDVLLMKVGPDGSSWMKLYDLGSASTELEDGQGVIHLGDGNFLVVGAYSAVGSLDAFAMKVDGDGAVIWARQYVSDGQTLLFNAALELPDGRMLVGGTGANYSGIIALLASDGTLEWVRRYDADGSPAGHGFTDVRPAWPNGYWVKSRYRQLWLSEALEGCDFSPLPDPQNSVFTPEVSSVAYTNLPYAPNVLTLESSGRLHEPSWVPICTVNSIADGTGQLEWSAYPDPSDGIVYLRGEGVLSGMTVVLRDAMGREVMRTRYEGMLDLSRLAPGGYLVECPEQGRRLRVVRR